MVLAANTHRSDPDQAELSNYLLRHRRTRKKRKRNRKVSVGMIGSPIRAAWRELCIMDYALRMVVEKVAISSQEVIKRDTINQRRCAVSNRHWRAGTAPYRAASLIRNAPFLTLCRASNLRAARRIPSPWQGAAPAKTRASSRPSGAHGHHLRPATNCAKLSDNSYDGSEF
jgi:hypothetical protein